MALVFSKLNSNYSNIKNGRIISQSWGIDRGYIHWASEALICWGIAPMTNGQWSIRATFPQTYTDAPKGIAHFVYNANAILNVTSISTTTTDITVGKTDSSAAGEMRYIAFGRKTVS